jgi:hypothetical protein
MWNMTCEGEIKMAIEVLAITFAVIFAAFVVSLMAVSFTS